MCLLQMLGRVHTAAIRYDTIRYDTCYRGNSLAFSLERYDKRHNTRNTSVCREQKEKQCLLLYCIVLYCIVLYCIVYINLLLYLASHMFTSLPVSLNSAAIFLHAKLVKSVLELFNVKFHKQGLASTNMMN
jgi:hypothetical protein